MHSARPAVAYSEVARFNEGLPMQDFLMNKNCPPGMKGGSMKGGKAGTSKPPAAPKPTGKKGY